MSKRTIANKKAGEHTTTMSLAMVISLIIVIVAVIIYFTSIRQLSEGMDDAKQKGICLRLMKTRYSVGQIELFDLGPGNFGPDVGQAILGTSLFYVSPACGNMYAAPCNKTSDCQERILTNIALCRKMQESEPDVSRPCLTDLEINVTEPPLLNPDDLCKSNAGVCGTGEKCGTTGVPNNMIDYGYCPQQGASIAIKYDKSTITVHCQGTGACKEP